MVIEIWKDILNYEGLYQVSNLGRVKGLKKSRIGENNEQSKKVIQYDKNMNKIKIWECISDVERKLKIDHSTIIRCAKHKQKTAGGYKWEYSL